MFFQIVCVPYLPLSQAAVKASREVLRQTDGKPARSLVECDTERKSGIVLVASIHV